ncbi:hypothetical protein [Flavobacterium sp.]|uniref:hypothetical protein n=1 Tax=Flavobacterium sp. TaxID=239 RepID=UPI003751BD02
MIIEVYNCQISLESINFIMPVISKRTFISSNEIKINTSFTVSMIGVNLPIYEERHYKINQVEDDELIIEEIEQLYSERLNKTRDFIIQEWKKIKVNRIYVELK